MCNAVVCAVLQSLCVGWFHAGVKKCVAHSLMIMQFFGFESRPSLLINSEPYFAEKNLNSQESIIIAISRLEVDENIQN